MSIFLEQIISALILGCILSTRYGVLADGRVPSNDFDETTARVKKCKIIHYSF